MKWFGTFLAVGLFTVGAWAGGPAVVINEVRTDQTGTDNDEYFELHGPASQSLNGLFYIVIGDTVGTGGAVECIVDLTGESIPADGHYLAVEDTFTLTSQSFADLVLSGPGNGLNFENSDNVTHVLVQGLNPAIHTGDGFGGGASDLDANDDNVIDANGDWDGDSINDGPPWTAVLDAIGLVETPGLEDLVYGAALGGQDLGPDGTFVPGHAYRMPNATGPFVIGLFAGGEDTPGFDNDNPPPITENAMTFVDKNELNVPVTLLATSANPNVVFRLLSGLPGGTGALRDDTTNPITVFPHDVDGTLLYNTPNATFTGSMILNYEAVGANDPAKAVIAVQDTANPADDGSVFITEFMLAPNGLDGVQEYVEIYNSSGGTITLYGLAGDLFTADVTNNLAGKSIGAGQLKVIAPKGTTNANPALDPDDESFRCEWRLAESDIIRVDAGTWAQITREESAIAIYRNNAGSPALLDAVWARNSAPNDGWSVNFDFGHALSIPDFFGPANASNNDGDPGTAFAYQLCGIGIGYNDQEVIESETLANFGSPADDITYFPAHVPGASCLTECCLPEGCCVVAYPLNCENVEFGISVPDDADCFTDPPSCSADVGYCCTDVGDCFEGMSEPACLGIAGNWGGAGTDCSLTPCTPLATVFINEIDYDNLGTDTNEFIELMGPPTTDLTGWTLELYNGVNNELYSSVALAGSIPASGFFVIGSATVPNVTQVAFTQDGIQNGAPDGIVLSNASNVAVDALAYEGSMTTATPSGGLHDGLVLSDIGTDDAGREGSMQLIPNGGIWTETNGSTPGTANGEATGQCCLPDGFLDTTAADCDARGGLYLGDGTADCENSPCADTCVTIAEARAIGTGVGVNLCNVTVNNNIDTVQSDFTSSFNVQDSTGALAVVADNATILSALGGAAEGDTLTLVGSTSSFNSLFQIGTGGVTLARIGAVTPGSPIVPTPITTTDLLDLSPTAEALESFQVSLGCVYFLDGDGVATFNGPGNGVRNYEVSDGVNTVEVRVPDEAIDLILNNELIPVGWVNIIGIFSQFDSGAAGNTGYQLLLRREADISVCGTPPTGACCDPSAMCTEVDILDCPAGSTFLGNGTDCTPNPCIPTGSCCTPSGTCVEDQTQDDCEMVLGGTYNGDDVDCASAPACVADPTGACCLPNGDCVAINEFDCENSLGGVYQGNGVSCGSVSCPDLQDGIVINEYWADDGLADDAEYIELFGTPGAPLTGLSVIVVDGDTAGLPTAGTFRQVTLQFDLSGTIPGDGFFVIGGGTTPNVDLAFSLGASGAIQNGSQTFALVETADIAYCIEDTGNPGFPVGTCDDIDNDELTPESVAAITASLVDAVAIIDNTVGDDTYFGAPVLTPNPDGFPWDTASRCPNGVDTDTPGDWDTQDNFALIIELGDPNDALSSPGLTNNCGGAQDLVAWTSCGIHGAQGMLCKASNSDCSVEGRDCAGLFSIDMTGPTAAATASANCGGGPIACTVTNGDPLIVNCSPLPNGACTVTLGGDAAGSLKIRVLRGDVDKNGFVNGADVTAIKPNLGQPVTPARANFDVDCNGFINGADVTYVKPKLGGVGAPCTP